MRHISSEHGQEPCKKFALNKCIFGQRCLFKHTNTHVQNAPNNIQEPETPQAPQVFLNPPTSGQNLTVGKQQEQMMYQMMSKMLTQMMKSTNLN